MIRQYSDSERNIMQSIYDAKDSHNYVLTNVFAHWLFNMPGIHFDLTKGSCIFDLSIYSDATTILSIKKEIIGTALFIKHLEDSGYIYIIQDQTSTPPPASIGARSITKPLEVDLPKDIAFIIMRSLYNVYVSYPLIYLIENEFKSFEDLQLLAANQQVRHAKITTRISVITCAIAIITLAIQIIQNIICW